MKKILIAEDDYLLKDVYQEIFESNDFEVETVENGKEAIAKIKSQEFDFILLDIVMPELSGLDVLREIRKLEIPNKRSPVFLITNLGQDIVIEEGFKAGMDGYIIKSQFTPQQIVDEVNKFLSDKEKTPHS